MVVHVDDTMSDQDFTLLSAYVDGELEPDVATALEQRLAQDSELRARLTALRGLQAELQAVARTGADSSPVPESIRALLQQQPSRIRSVPHRLATFSATVRRQGLAVAASLAVIAGLLLAPQWQREVQEQTGDPLLAAALEALPSRAEGWDILEDGRQLRAILSFPKRSGSWCREYLLAAESHAVRGVACRDNGIWETRVAVTQTLFPGAEDVAYRPASTGESNRIASFIAQHAAGDAAGAGEEAGLISNQWR